MLRRTLVLQGYSCNNSQKSWKEHKVSEETLRPNPGEPLDGILRETPGEKKNREKL